MRKNRYRTQRKRRRTRFGDILPVPLLLVLGGLLLVAGALFAVWRAGQPADPQVAVEVSGAPSLKVSQERVDLGDVKVGKTVSVSFRLANVGDEPLRFNARPFVEVVEGC